MKRKVINKKLFIIVVLLLFCSCTSIDTSAVFRPYDIIGTEKIEKNNTYREINKKYGIDISIKGLGDKGHIWIEDKNNIKFYNDIIITIKDIKYTIPKEKIKMIQNNFGGISGYVFEIKKDAIDAKVNEIIIEIGIIEKLDENDKIVKLKVKVPPIILKKFLEIRESAAIFVTKEIFKGWAEDVYDGEYHNNQILVPTLLKLNKE